MIEKRVTDESSDGPTQGEKRVNIWKWKFLGLGDHLIGKDKGTAWVMYSCLLWEIKSVLTNTSPINWEDGKRERKSREEVGALPAPINPPGDGHLLNAWLLAPVS